MEIAGIGVMLVGTIITIVGTIKFVLRSFDEGLLWGLGVIFFPIVAPIFLILYWSEAWRPALTAVIGYAIVCVGWFLKTGSFV